MWISFKNFISYLFASIVGGGGGAQCHSTGSGQKVACRNWFSPSSMQVPGIEVRLSPLATSASAC